MEIGGPRASRRLPGAARTPAGAGRDGGLGGGPRRAGAAHLRSLTLLQFTHGRHPDGPYTPPPRRALPRLRRAREPHGQAPLLVPRLSRLPPRAAVLTRDGS